MFLHKNLVPEKIENLNFGAAKYTDYRKEKSICQIHSPDCGGTKNAEFSSDSKFSPDL